MAAFLFLRYAAGMTDWLYSLARPLLFRMDPERAHHLALSALKTGIFGRAMPDYPRLKTRVFGIDFPNPVGLAAGFDKDGEAASALLGLGFGFAELGTVTPLPQDGNPRPRLFRDISNKSVINRMGFPGRGLAHFRHHLSHYRAFGRGGVIGINIGINKNTISPTDDYRRCIDVLAPFADYITINVSSPNTAGLRDLQARDALGKLLAALTCPKPRLLKIAPDLGAEARADVAALAQDHQLAGLIIGNTTITRPEALDEKLKGEAGGLSGALLKNLALDNLRDYARLTAGKIPLIAAGGVASAADAYERIRAGASLVQLYSALVFEGPGLPQRIAQGLDALLARDGFATVAEAVGADLRRQ